jgi:hypothetical protein
MSKLPRYYDNRVSWSKIIPHEMVRHEIWGDIPIEPQKLPIASR